MSSPLQARVEDQAIVGSAVTGEAFQMRSVTVYAYGRGASSGQRVGRVTLAAPAAGRSLLERQFAASAFTVAIDATLPGGTYDLLVVGSSDLSTSLQASVWIRGVVVR